MGSPFADKIYYTSQRITKLVKYAPLSKVLPGEMSGPQTVVYEDIELEVGESAMVDIGNGETAIVERKL